MRRTAQVLACALILPLLLGALPAAASAATFGIHQRFVEARAFYRVLDETTGIQYGLDISLQAGTWQRLHSTTSPDRLSQPQPFAQVWAYYSEWDTFGDTAITELSSWTDLAEGQYAVDGLDYAALFNVPITVNDAENNPMASFTVTLEWVGNGDVKPWVVLGDVPVPSPMQPPAIPGISWVEHYNTAALDGTVATPPFAFTLGDIQTSEIGEVTVLISPAR